jgi:small subunit ribosomal protein S3Ae
MFYNDFNDYSSDPFLRKDIYSIKAPTIFATRNAGKTIISRTSGTSKSYYFNNVILIKIIDLLFHKEIATEGLKGRVFEFSLSDLNGGDEGQAFRKIRLIAEDVQGNDIITNFHGLDMTRDKLCSLIRKWQTLIEAHVDVVTTDGYKLRIFIIAFTKKQAEQAAKSTCYAQAGQVRSIRKKMFEVVVEEATKCDLKELVQKL